MDQLDIECSICLEEYDMNNPASLKSPRVLKCGHTFSFDCLKGLFEINQINKLICPIDQIETPIENINELGLNRSFIDTYTSHVEFVKKSISNNKKANEDLSIETKKKINENKGLIIDWEGKLYEHINSIKTVMTATDKTIKDYGKDSAKTRPLSKYESELKTDLEFFAEKLLIIKKKKEHLYELENELENNNNKSIDKLVNLHIKIAKFPANLEMLMNDEKITKNPMGLSKFLEMEKKLKSKTSILLQIFKDSKKQKKIHIGVIGLMSINLTLKI